MSWRCPRNLKHQQEESLLVWDYTTRTELESVLRARRSLRLKNVTSRAELLLIFLPLSKYKITFFEYFGVRYEITVHRVTLTRTSGTIAYIRHFTESGNTLSS